MLKNTHCFRGIAQINRAMRAYARGNIGITELVKIIQDAVDTNMAQCPRVKKELERIGRIKPAHEFTDSRKGDINET